MRTLLAIVILAALAWGGWWFFQSSMRDRALTAWLEERRAAGWVAEAEDVSVSGFPNRVDSTVTRLSLADPAAGWSWQADALEILSLSWKPHHIIAALPGQQVVSTPYQTLTFDSELLRGSVLFRPNTRLELDHSTFEIEGMEIVGNSGWTAGIGEALLATRQAEGQAFAHDVSFTAENIRLPGELLAATRSEGVLPPAASRLALDATMRFDGPWDRSTVEAGSPALLGIDVRDVSVTWGSLDLRGRGMLGVDARGYAEGKLDIRARNWQQMLDLAERAGAVDPTLAGAIRGGLGLIARLSGDADAIEVPLAFENGWTRLGPIPVGPAPVLARRG